ncbi:DoxX family protein [Solicola sp. PLA-1-18]|uniref:DoxX family protein n=1 Tax=Solicola sp. PLA-1-18 TaxID=3380532 RepID=UPI003B800A2C
MTLLRVVARPMLASIFVVGGLNEIRNAKAMAPAAKPVTDKIVPPIARAVPQAPIPTDEATLVRLNGAVELIGGLALATGRFPRFSALALASSLVPVTFAGHRYWEETDPGTRQNQKIHFLKNASILGGLLLSSLDPEPQKKVWPRRAKDRTVDLTHRAVDAVQDLRP